MNNVRERKERERDAILVAIMELIFQIGLVILLVLLNGYFVASEYALVSIRKTKVEELVKKKNITARLLQSAINNLSTYISATQLGVTLASLALGWIGEPAVAHLIEPLLGGIPQPIAFITAHGIAVLIGFCAITYFHIVLGELVPKSVALSSSERVSLMVITPLALFVKIFKPFIWLLNMSGQFVLKLFRLQGESKKQSVHSEEEVRMILRQSSESGEIPVKEVEMVYNVFQLGDIPVKRVMVHRGSMLAFSANTKLKDVIKKIEKHPHSRFPVYKNSINTISGFIHIKDLYRAVLKLGDNVTLSESKIIRKGIVVNETKKIGALLTEMRKKRLHLAVVKNEKKKTVGIVTLEDVIESVVGEIEDEFDKPEKETN